MVFYDKSCENTVKELNSNILSGLCDNGVIKNRNKYGKNVLTKKKKKSLFSKIISALSEPMLIILIFGFLLTFGVGLGKYFKTGEKDFVESFGVLGAIVLSVSIAIIMEGSSEKAFSALSRIYDQTTIKVIRNGKISLIAKESLVVGDIILLESGDKIVADGRILESNLLSVDESALTGESIPCQKLADVILPLSTILAERKNCVYSGTFVINGSAKVIVTAVGDSTEIGGIASELKKEKEVPSPLSQKLSKLGKIITIVGVVFAIIVFVISLIKLYLLNSLSFSEIQSLFISCVVLIVAAVPEGLPTIVAVSLALNMIKLAKENALIKKMTATETTGAVSIICSDKTGTLTENKITLLSICGSGYCISPDKIKSIELLQNFVCNSTADVVLKNNKTVWRGSGTECALITAFGKSYKKESYIDYRKKYKVIYREPFSSVTKIMKTTIIADDHKRTLIKGAPEKVLPLCNVTESQKQSLYNDMSKYQKQAKRVLCFAHSDGIETIFDGYAVLMDKIRSDVKDAIETCKKAGIKIKILTGDNYLTAFAIANELGVAYSENQVINGSEIEKMTDEELKRILSKITVVARSTPLIKLRIVKALKALDEVVAVTGDGINDAPAIKHADVGIAMGKSGSDICKESADIVLLDDGFSTIVNAISFGRNVYQNLQRFIVFQLSVNVSALLFITITSIMGISTPFSTLQLLWINVIMDGPPAITLGLGSSSKDLMNQNPIKRSQSIVSKKMLFIILFNGIFVSGIMCLQYFKNILGVSQNEESATIFTLFIVFQLFNAFNSRELGSQSIFKSLGKNKIMLLTFLGAFLIQIIIVQYAYKIFGIYPLAFLSWIKIFLLAFSIIVVSESFKFVYRKLFLKKENFINKKRAWGIN